MDDVQKNADMHDGIADDPLASLISTLAAIRSNSNVADRVVAYRHLAYGLSQKISLYDDGQEVSPAIMRLYLQTAGQDPDPACREEAHYQFAGMMQIPHDDLATGPEKTLANLSLLCQTVAEEPDALARARGYCCLISFPNQPTGLSHWDKRQLKEGLNLVLSTIARDSDTETRLVGYSRACFMLQDKGVLNVLSSRDMADYVELFQDIAVCETHDNVTTGQQMQVIAAQLLKDRDMQIKLSAHYTQERFDDNKTFLSFQPEAVTMFPLPARKFS